MPRKELRRLLQMLLALGLLLLIICAWVQEVRRQQEIEQSREQEVARINVLDREGRVLSLGLEDFLIGVVAAETPAAFAQEALQAQAVAARTYILSAQAAGGRHQQAAVCMDPACCQAYSDPEQLRRAWGGDFQENYHRISRAVQATAGQALYYQERLAQTPFHSCCGGKTESAAACWGGAREWLVSVDCGYCRHAARFCGSSLLPLAQAADLLDCSVEELAGLSALDYSQSGRLSTLQLGRRVLRATELRSALGLNSTACTWLIFGDNIVFTTIGYGHGVGLCQYGADGMGREGYDYQEILAHYYPGTELREPLIK